MGPNICFITSLDVNVGDEFIREGICSFLDELLPDWNPYYVNKVELETIYKKVKEEKSVIGDKLVNADVIIQAGAPVYWNLGESTSYNVEWAEELWFKRIFQLGPEKPILNIAAGACQPFPDVAKSFLSDPKCVEFAKNIDRSCRWTSVRDPLASQILYALNIPHDVLPCTAFHAARRIQSPVQQKKMVGVNLMPFGGHFKLRDDIDPSKWLEVIKEILPEIRKNHRIMFIAHDLQEKQFMKNFAFAGEHVFISTDYHDYMKAYGSCSTVIANRVHGAVCAAGFGCPAIIVGNDTRLQIADYIGLPSYYVGTVMANDILKSFDKAVSSQKEERDRLITLREESASRYRLALTSMLGLDFNRPGVSSSSAMQRLHLETEPVRLALVDELHSDRFADFMKTMNCFAERSGLRQFTNWSKLWEYPWLWQHGISGKRDWKSISILDLGSEISPMPWFLASFGAKVTLVECDKQWIEIWEKLKTDTGLAVDWNIVLDEHLPFNDSSFDIVTSFSVIEHQNDKRLAVDEVCRVLKPGGLFALSFDICEPDMGMTFPEWNGHALTMGEFEEVVWNHPGFLAQGTPVWNTEDIPPFIEWHRKTAEHHNYVVGAAVLRKKPLAEASIKNILIPRFDTFGDLVLMEGFVEQIRKFFPAAHITMLVRSGYEQISKLFPMTLAIDWLSVEGNPYHSAEEQERNIFDECLDQLSAKTWDLIIFTAFNRSWMDNALALKFTNVFKIAIGAGSSIDGWPTAQLMVIPVDEKSHETAKYQTLLSAFTGGNETLPSPRLEIGAEFQSLAAEIIAKLGLADVHYVACFPAGTKNQTGKVWPLERYAELLLWLYSEFGHVPLLLGHQDERETIQSLASMLEGRGVTAHIWLGGDGEIPVLAGLFQRARLYVGNDTGPMHIAAAVGIPVVGIFGGGTFPRFLPVGERAIGVAGELPCFGCMWSCIFSDAPCMRLVTVDDVKNAVRMVLDHNPPGTNHLPVMAGCSERLEELMHQCIRLARQNEERRNSLPSTVATSTDLPEVSIALYQECKDNLRAVELSLSWRITKPLRTICDWMLRCLK